MQIRTTSDPIFSSGYGHSIRDERPGNSHHPRMYPPPDEVYLIYITMTNNRLTVKHMNERLLHRSVDELEEILFDAAARPGPTKPQPVGDSFRRLTWVRPCYLTLVLDLQDWEFYWGSTVGDDPLIFRRSKPGVSMRYHANHSFYNAVSPTVGGRHAVRCMNYLKRNARADDLRGYDRTRNYSIDINVLTPFSDVDANPIKVIIDPDGQNQGPPSLPPSG